MSVNKKNGFYVVSCDGYSWNTYKAGTEPNHGDIAGRFDSKEEAEKMAKEFNDKYLESILD